MVVDTVFPIVLEEEIHGLLADFKQKGTFGSITIHFANGEPKNLEVRTNRKIE